MKKESDKKSVGILTFHASHNYGSMLQAYALQRTIENLGFDTEIINFRTERQKSFYKPMWRQGSLYERFKRFVLSLPNIKSVLHKQELFENFLNENLHLTAREYSSLDELRDADMRYDYYVTGSDQIWNTLILDFDWAYFLPFVKNGKRIAYAPSMGPTPELTSSESAGEIIELLENYCAASVREQRTADYFKRIANVELPVVLDPTLLLDVEHWEEFAGDAPLIDGEYCFCYSPWMNDKVVELAFSWAASHNMKVVVSKPFIYLSSMLKWRNATMFIDVGPREFLNLCKYAKMVCCDSFHSVVFSIFFRTPFAALDGGSDARISNLLNMTNLEGRSVELGKTPSDSSIDFEFALNKIRQYRIHSYEWLMTALNK